MKLKFLIILIIFSGCQKQNSGLSSDLSDHLKKQGNPTLLAIQFLTVEIKKENQHWPKSTADYVEAFSDSVNVIFSEFENLEFKHQNDTLRLQYTLKDPKRVTNYDFQFVDSQLYTDSAKVKFNSEIENTNNKKKFEPDEGRMSFYEVENYFYVIHEYEGGLSKNEIMIAQQ